jgi:hypothetical protein
MSLGVVCLMMLGMQVAPSPGDLRLPAAVRGTSESYNLPGGSAPYERLDFEIHPEWVRTLQWLPQGSLGWAQHDLTLDTAGASFLYKVGTRRGSLGKRLDSLGYSRAEMKVSPLGWLRAMRVQEARGATLTTRDNSGLSVISCEVYAGTTLSLHVDRAAQTVVKATLTNAAAPNTGSTYEYLDWQELPDGTHHPRLIRETIVAGGGRTLDGETRVLDLQPVPPAPAPDLPQLPKEAIIHDTEHGTVLDGSWQAVGQMAPPTSRDTGSGGRTWLVAGIVGVLALAGVIWQKRRGAW